MTCPKCGSYQHHVFDSRYTKDGQGKYRRRVCHDCGHRWGSQEIPFEEYKRLVRCAKLIDEISATANDLKNKTEGGALFDEGTA